MIRRIRIGIGKTLGFILFWTFRPRAEVVRQNLKRIIHDPLVSKKLFRQHYEHLGHLIVEVLIHFIPLRLGGFRGFVKQEAELTGIEYWEKARQSGKGVFFLSSHVGNWEVMAASGAVLGIPIMLVTKRLKPAWVHRVIEKSRRHCGVLGTYEPKTLRDLLGHLKTGGTVGFVLDQYAGPPVGIRVPFFGTWVGTHSALATLVKRTGAIVLPAVNYRTPQGSFRTEIGPPIEWTEDLDPQKEIWLNTYRYSQEMERQILAHPDQWLWVHRRFKGDLSS